MRHFTLTHTDLKGELLLLQLEFYFQCFSCIHGELGNKFVEIRECGGITMIKSDKTRKILGAHKGNLIYMLAVRSAILPAYKMLWTICGVTFDLLTASQVF